MKSFRVRIALAVVASAVITAGSLWVTTAHAASAGAPQPSGAVYTRKQELMAVLVMRCDEGQPWVPSRIVQCSRCGANCWLSLETGESTLALGRVTGDPEINCGPCFEARLESRQSAGQ